VVVDGLALPPVEAVDALAANTIPAFLAHVAALQVRAAARLAVTPVERAPAGDEPLLTVPEAAKLLAFPDSYVRELTRKGELPCVRNGKYVRVAPADLRRWIEQHRDREVDPAPSLLYASRRRGPRARRSSEVN
jgi:excisionase family DNA binding protein